MNTKTLRIACLAAACTFSLVPRGWTDDAGARAEETPGSVSITTDASVNADQAAADGGAEITPGPKGGSRVSDVYKASGLIGMEVKNRRNENLGQIKDMVIDLESGRISYVVLSTGGFLGIGDKMVAVPPNAFEIIETQDGIVLNTDRDSLRNARGLARNDWPDVRNPAWGAETRFDRADSGRAAVDVEVGTKSSDTTDDARHHSEKSERAESSDDHVFRGKIESVDSESRTLTVRGEEGTRTFHLDDKPVLVLGDNRNPRLVDFKVGYSVVVGYGKEGDDVAHRLQRTDVGAGQFK